MSGEATHEIYFFLASQDEMHSIFITEKIKKVYNKQFKHRISNYKRDRCLSGRDGIHVRLLRFIYDDVA